MKLEDLGWSEYFSALFEPHREAGLSAGRVTVQHRERCLVSGEEGSVLAEVSGLFRHKARDRSAYPTTGDWVAFEPFGRRRALIHAVLERRSAFVRKTAGGLTEAQVVAANVDVVFLVTGLDGDFNLRRIERYLTTAWDSGASPVVVMNKSDLRPDIDDVIAEVETICLGTPVVAVSALDGSNLDALRVHLPPGTTAALLGSSGAGKSTLINRLLGDGRLATGPVREGDSRGRHTTARRELVVLPGGACLIDTPGMRELQLWADEESLACSFDDVEALAGGCRFADCRHEGEPGCAVREAVSNGDLDAGRLESYLKQREELRRLAVKKDSHARRQADKEFGKKIASVMKDLKLRKPSYR
jgi:ribosome biogenesis GTPase